MTSTVNWSANVCLTVRIPQQKSFALNWYIPSSQYRRARKKIEIDNLKHCFYCKLINQCLTVRIPRMKKLRTELEYTSVDHSTAEQGKNKDNLKQCVYCKLIDQCLTVYWHFWSSSFKFKVASFVLKTTMYILPDPTDYDWKSKSSVTHICELFSLSFLDM